MNTSLTANWLQKLISLQNRSNLSPWTGPVDRVCAVGTWWSIFNLTNNMQAVTQHTSQASLLSVQGKNTTPEHIQQASFPLLKISTAAESPGDHAVTSGTQHTSNAVSSHWYRHRAGVWNQDQPRLRSGFWPQAIRLVNDSRLLPLT